MFPPPEFLLAQVCTSWIDLIICFFSSVSCFLPPYFAFWKISLKCSLVFNFKILVALVPKVLSCFLMIPYFYSCFRSAALYFSENILLKAFSFEFCYGSYIVSLVPSHFAAVVCFSLLLDENFLQVSGEPWLSVHI